MSQLTESELLEAFAARLKTLSPEREERLLAFDYHPSRARRRGRAWAAIGTGGTALVGGIAAAILMLSSGASVAEGWTAVPSPPTAGAVAAATTSCNWLHDLNGPPILTGTPILTDGRGSYTAAIYVKGHTAHICISDGQHTATSLEMNNMSLHFDAKPGPDQLGDPSGSGGSAPGFPGSTGSTTSNQYEDVKGLAGRDVSAVTFEFAHGSSVKATVQNGWYFAWWPGDRWPSSVRVGTNTGTRTSPMSVATCMSKSTGCVFAGWNHIRPSAS
jgi:hypothetical protein